MKNKKLTSYKTKHNYITCQCAACQKIRGDWTCTEKTRKIMSKTAKNRKHSEITKEKISALMKNRKITWGDKISKAMKNKPKTEEQKKKISKTLRKKYANGELKINNWNEGLTKETDSRIKAQAEKMSRLMIGKKNHFYNHKHTEESKERIRKATIKRIVNHKFPFIDTKIERLVKDDLTDKNIKFIDQKRINNCVVDIFIKPNICIFCDGDYWHANPLKYFENDIIKGMKAKTI